MLIGTYEHSVDAKGRVFIPVKWREDLGSTVYVTRSFTKRGGYRSLFGMSEAAWNKIVEKASTISVTDVTAITAVKKMLALASECELDKQGRILLPTKLREVAELTDEVSLLGQGGRFEIWNRQRWDAELLLDDDEEMEALARLTDIGI